MDTSDITGFNTVELQMVGLIRGHVNNILSGRARTRELSLEWIYNSFTQLGHVDIHECCAILGLPLDLLRIRMQYELFKKSIAWDKVSCNLPLVIQEEIFYYHSQDVYHLANLIWHHPGIKAENLSPHESLIENMLQSNLIMQNETNQIWLTCRNPVKSKNIHWSRCWSFYDQE